MHVLIIEDDLDLGPTLLSSLQQEGISGVRVRPGVANAHRPGAERAGAQG
jgi:hypothetical protein